MGSSKRFGARYGNRIRKNVDEAESKDENYERIAAGIWKDRETGEIVTGGAYKQDTGANQLMKKALQTEVDAEELEAAKEELGVDE